MAGAVGAVRVQGLAELTRAFGKLSAELKFELVAALTKAAAPVAATAAQKSWSEIRNMDARWSRMRVGANPGLVYVAPGSRNAGGSPRPNLGSLLMNRAMQPALDEHTPELEAAVESVLDALSAKNGF